MLKSDYDIVEVMNHNDIHAFVEETLEKWKNEKIHRLHFHFSGHGEINQIVNTGKSTQSRPIWECMVNDDGTLTSVYDVQYLLTQFKSEMITLALDCCRTLSLQAEEGRELNRRNDGALREIVKTQDLHQIPISDWEKMVTFHAIPQSDPDSDEDCMTNELFKVYKEKNHRIPITQLAHLLNNSWEQRGVSNQRCMADIIEVFRSVEGRDNWEGIFWPL